MESAPSFSQRLRETGLTATEIGRRCGVTRQEAGLWLAGQIRRPHPRNLRRIERLIAAVNANGNGGGTS